MKPTTELDMTYSLAALQRHLLSRGSPDNIYITNILGGIVTITTRAHLCPRKITDWPTTKPAKRRALKASIDEAIRALEQVKEHFDL